jgi:stearoyl-CoA desaturase (delta-9 desaturase)
MLIVPALGTVAALLRAREHGISPLEIALFILMYAAAMAGITVGYHRYFAHGAFKTSRPVTALFAICGSMAGQGPVVYWVSNHRMHHQFTDAPGDPHSPYFDGDRPLSGLAGFFHAHLGWTWRHKIPNTMQYAKDLLKDEWVRSVSERYLLWLALGLLLPAAVGGLVGGAGGAVSGLLWGGFVRMFVGYQVALSIGSFAHTFGDRPWDIRGHSANNVWLALPTFGEGWHQNHHAHPTSAAFGLGRAQPDVGLWVIRALAALRLIWDGKAPEMNR